MRIGDEMANKKFKYHTVGVPGQLAEKIEEVIASNKHGYTTIPDFVRVAIMKYLRELGYIA